MSTFFRHPVVVVGGGGVHSDNRGTYSFGHSALLGSHENFRFGQKIWVWAKRGWSDIDDQSQNGTEARVFV